MPMDRSKYPFNWELISTTIRFGRARGFCENCGAQHGYAHPQTGSRVILTTHHINHDKMDSHPDNLLALCQLCHLAADMEHHIQNRRANAIVRQLNAGQAELPLPNNLTFELASQLEQKNRVTASTHQPTLPMVTAMPPARASCTPTLSPSEPSELPGLPELPGSPGSSRPSQAQEPSDAA